MIARVKSRDVSRRNTRIALRVKMTAVRKQRRKIFCPYPSPSASRNSGLPSLRKHPILVNNNFSKQLIASKYCLGKMTTFSIAVQNFNKGAGAEGKKIVQDLTGHRNILVNARQLVPGGSVQSEKRSRQLDSEIIILIDLNGHGLQNVYFLDDAILQRLIYLHFAAVQ